MMTILAYYVNVDFATLKKEGFRVVSVVHTHYIDPWSYVSPKTVIFLERGKKCAYRVIYDKHVEMQIEAEPSFEHEYSDEDIDLETLLALPEETLEEKEARELQEIIDAARITRGGTKIYIVPSKVVFFAPEPESIMIQAEKWIDFDGNRYYKVLIPDLNLESERLFQIAKTEHVNGFGYASGKHWLQTTEPHLEALLEKITA